MPQKLKVAAGILCEAGKTDILQFILQKKVALFLQVETFATFPASFYPTPSTEASSSATTDANVLTSILLTEYLPAFSSYL